MALEVGQRLGPYQIEAAVGAGGMGEVYRATDTRLDRKVAVKVVAGDLVKDAAMRERFEREARAAAALSHPHICAVYDVGRWEGTSYLVMEYLEGETLSTRMARKTGASMGVRAAQPPSERVATASRASLPIEQIVRCGAQVADALDCAHRNGVIHRDIKPGNIMLTKTGVKVLDFGLAKNVGPASRPVEQNRSAVPTALTDDGKMIGTVPYMAPERLEGKAADARADIFALAAVLYEMLTGRPPFEGKSQASLIAAILEHEPDPIAALRPSVPPPLERLVVQCLAKDPDERWQSARDVRRQLEWIGEAGLQTGAPAPRRRAWAGRAAAAAVLVASALLAASAWLRPEPPVAPARRWHLQVPVTSMRDPSSLGLSPDGRWLALVASDAGGRDVVKVRALDSRTEVALEGTEGARLPFWSPRGDRIGFAAEGKLKTTDFPRGSVRELSDLKGLFLGGTWSGDDTVLFSTHPGGVFRINADGGRRLAVSVGAQLENRPVYKPFFLFDNLRFVFTSRSEKARDGEAYLGWLDGRDPVLLATARSHAEASPDGRLVSFESGVLVARPFDLERGTVREVPQPIADEIAPPTGSGQGVAPFSISRTGVLAYRTAGGQREQFVWLDRDGRKVGDFGEPGDHQNFDLGPDGKSVVFSVHNPKGSTRKLHLLDGIRPAIVIPTGGIDATNDPVWSPDGLEVAFTARGKDRRNVLMKQAASGGDQEVILKREGHDLNLEDWSRDGRWIAFEETGMRRRGGVLRLGEAQEPIMFGQDFSNIDEIHFSPDGAWLAYNAITNDRWEVYVSRHPPAGESWQVSTGGGVQPHWRGDGRELYFLDPRGTLMAVAVTPGKTFAWDPPRPLFDTGLFPKPNLDQYAVSGDGRRFLVDITLDPPERHPVQVIVNWGSQ